MTDEKSIARKNNTLALIMIGVLAVMLIPMAPIVLDALLCLSIMVSLLIVMAVINSKRPADFSTFPSVLLFTVLFRLSLNVASTRLILLEADAGNVIETFGQFVVGGNPVVGVIIFLIIVIIQFVVITKGQNRISEVAARFTLDALPGKQMSVDADLNAGLITSDEAKARRKDFTQEAEFYGAMDGAGKFVRGDAIAGLIITVINIAGGLIIGIANRGMAFGDAVQTYTILTVGDGLVSQIPGLLISTSAGLLVTKSSTEEGLGDEMGSQILSRSSALYSVAAILAGLSLLPGMPFVLLVSLAALLVMFAGTIRTKGKAGGTDDGDSVEETHSDVEAPIEELLTVDRLGIEIGYRLISLVEPGRHGGLLDHIRSVRRQFASSLGLVIPPIRVKDNIQIDPNGYRILLNGQEVAHGELRAGNYLAMDPGGIAGALPGLDTVEPAFGLAAKWIAEAEKDRAELQGYTVIDAPSVLVTHLTEVLKRISSELLTRDDAKGLIDNLKKVSPAVVEELIPNQLTVGQVQQVLAALLKEQVPIRNLQSILEALSDSCQETKDLRLLTEKVRARLSRTIVEPHLDKDGTLHAAVIDPDLERNLADTVAGAEGIGNLPQGFLSRFVDQTAEALSAMAKEGRNPVLVTRSSLRPFLAEAIAGVIPNAAVISYQETGSATRVETSTRIAVPTS